MRTLSIALMIACIGITSAGAKEKRLRVAAVEGQESVEQQKMLDEVKSLLQSRPALRIKVVPGMGVKDVFPRWSHAVCIGCDTPPKPPRVLHTYPFRILAGVLAGDDDERERRGIRIR